MNNIVSEMEKIKSELYLIEEKKAEGSGPKRGRKKNSDEISIIVRSLKSGIIDVYKAILLILKLQYKKFCESRPAGSSDAAEDQPRGFFPGANETLSVEAMYKTIGKGDKTLSREGIDEARFATILDQIMSARLHISGSIDSNEFNILSDNLKKETELFRDASEKKYREVFLEYKKYLFELTKKAEDLLFEMEDKRIRNEEINNKWMNIFGKIYIEFLQAESELNLLKCRYELKSQFPDKTREELDRMVVKRQKEEKEKLQKAQNDLARAAYTKMLKDSIPADYKNMPPEEYIKKYNDDCKKKLLRIFKMAHPDSTISNKKLTEKQKKTLSDFFENAIKIRDSEAGFHVRSLSVLDDIYDSVKNIWELEGLDINYDAIIKGNTLQEKVEWLAGRIEYYELQISDIRNRIHAMANDRDIIEKVESMSSNEMISTISKQIAGKTEAYRNEIAELEIKIAAL